MKHVIIAALAAAIGGTVFGFALGIFVYPFWFLQGTAMEQLAESPTRTEVAKGSFVHVNPSDPVHWGKGDASIYREPGNDAIVFLHDTFEVGPGPRFHVYLVDHPNVRSGSDCLSSRQVDLGRLRAFTGSQVYPVPRGISAADYKSVVIWCKEFGVLISPATLRMSQDRGNRGISQRLPIPGGNHRVATMETIHR